MPQNTYEKRHLHIVPPKDKQEIISEHQQDRPTIGGEELEQVLNPSDDYLEFVWNRMRKDPETLDEILHSLLKRRVDKELPVEETSGEYKQHLLECPSLVRSTAKLLELDAVDEDNRTHASYMQSAARLLSLEMSKSHWLEKHVYPHMYKRAVSVAQGDVTQHFTKALAGTEDEKFLQRLDKVHVDLYDRLHYLSFRYNPNQPGSDDPDALGSSAPDHEYALVFVKEHYTEDSEWDIYTSTVQQLLRYSSHRSLIGKWERNSLYDKKFLRENEELVNIATYLVANQHERSDRPRLRGEGEMAEFQGIPYHRLANIRNTISLPEIMRGMLSADGHAELHEKYPTIFSQVVDVESVKK